MSAIELSWTAKKGEWLNHRVTTWNQEVLTHLKIYMIYCPGPLLLIVNRRKEYQEHHRALLLLNANDNCLKAAYVGTIMCFCYNFLHFALFKIRVKINITITFEDGERNKIIPSSSLHALILLHPFPHGYRHNHDHDAFCIHPSSAV